MCFLFLFFPLVFFLVHFFFPSKIFVFNLLVYLCVCLKDKIQKYFYPISGTYTICKRINNEFARSFFCSFYFIFRVNIFVDCEQKKKIVKNVCLCALIDCVTVDRT
jgi:hypothetical protein